MKNTLGGLLVFIIHIGTLFIFSKSSLLAEVNTAPWWYTALTGLITALYIYFGYQTFTKEGRHVVGVIFYLLALMGVFLIIMMNASF